MRRAVFLDRDGTLNPDPGYISRPEDFELFPWSATAMARLKKAGFLLILITNQSGISRGLITEAQLTAIHAKLQQLLAAENARLDAIYHCPHHPEFVHSDGISDCECRKPRPGMILQALKDFNIDAAASFMVGDRSSDVKIALNTGIQPVFIGAQPLKGHEQVPFFKDLAAAADFILKAAEG